MTTDQGESWLERPRARIAEAAKLAGVTRRTIERWIETGKIRGFRISRRRYVLREDLENLVEVIPTRPGLPRRLRPRRGSNPAREAQRRHNKDVIDEFLRRGKYARKGGKDQQ
jgi:excisionase family DNA binding protein